MNHGNHCSISLFHSLLANFALTGAMIFAPQALSQQSPDGLASEDDEIAIMVDGPEDGIQREHYKLEFGPVLGFTTGWNEAPEDSVFPLGATVAFRVMNASEPVRSFWNGNALQIPVTASLISLVLTEDQDLRVTTPDGLEIDVHIRCIPVTPAMLSLTYLVEEQHPFLLDDSATNAETLSEFMLKDSLATIDMLGAATYLTSTDKRIVFNSSAILQRSGDRSRPVRIRHVDPIDLDRYASLVEWRIDGVAVGVGDAVTTIKAPGLHSVEVGPPGFAHEFEFVTYDVQIESDVVVGSIPDNYPVTYRATTTPPGYEDRVRWLASTKYGAVYPVVGIGETFTTTFENTFEFQGNYEVFSWLGVKADSLSRGQDQKTGGAGIEIVDNGLAFGQVAGLGGGAFDFRVTGWQTTQTGQGLDSPFTTEIVAVAGAICTETLSGCRGSRSCTLNANLGFKTFKVKKTYTECGSAPTIECGNSITGGESILPVSQANTTCITLGGGPVNAPGENYVTSWSVVGVGDVFITPATATTANLCAFAMSSTGVVTVTRRSSRTLPSPHVIIATVSIKVGGGP